MRRLFTSTVLTLAIIGLVMFSETTTVKADGEFTVTPLGEERTSDTSYWYQFYIRNVTTQTISISAMTITWDGGGSIHKISAPNPAFEWSGSNYVSPFYWNFGYPVTGNIAPNGTIWVTIFLSNITQTPSNLVFNGVSVPSLAPTATPSGATATPGPTPTVTPFGAATATSTPTPTATPRPEVEATVKVRMQIARDSISTTLNLDNIAPYDWRASGNSFNFPNIFDQIIAPYTGLIFSYMLALMEIFNTNNVVIIIFILTISVSILMIVVKMVSGGALHGWDSTGIKDAVDNPYRAINRKR